MANDGSTAPERRSNLFPRAPAVNTTTDFVVTVFVVTVATILVLITVGMLAAALFTDVDIAPYFNVITDIMTTIIGALVGFIAGKGSGKAEAATEHAEREMMRERTP